MPLESCELCGTMDYLVDGLCTFCDVHLTNGSFPKPPTPIEEGVTDTKFILPDDVDCMEELKEEDT